MDVTQALKDAENSLRDFVSAELSHKYGRGWESHSGVSDERIAKWHERRDTEHKRQSSGVVDERLIYYADFYDLRTILKKNWAGTFSEALGDWKTFEVYLIELERLRDPDAHRRELLPHQKNLILGISGEIRTRIVRYRSRRETTEDCFPRIESARDSLGNIWIPESSSIRLNILDTKLTLRPGYSIDYVLSARDPEDTPLEYGISHEMSKGVLWQGSGSFKLLIEEGHIAMRTRVSLYIRSSRSYHAIGNYDDKVSFYYQVLPNRI